MVTDPGWQKPPISKLHVICDARLRTWLSYSSQKSCAKIWFGLVEPFKSYRGNKQFLREQKIPIKGGLHLTCDAHFRTRMSYSSHKSCVKIWFELVEIGGMLILRGARNPY